MMKRYAVPKTAEFKARQMALDFGALVQRAIHDSRALLRANLERIKKNWRLWFPKTASRAHQLVLELDEIAHMPLFNREQWGQ